MRTAQPMVLLTSICLGKGRCSSTNSQCAQNVNEYHEVGSIFCIDKVRVSD